MDLVLADPPYDVDTGEIEAVLGALTAHGWRAREPWRRWSGPPPARR
ncbi:hypothetical protein I552_4848 [Mycobacterium xenopi 3993]|nr:hypothetical protein I552_4848 [Mycobacterium xenopi 3993]